MDVRCSMLVRSPKMLAFAQRAQVAAGAWTNGSLLDRVSACCDLVQVIPHVDSNDERVIVVRILQQFAARLFDESQHTPRLVGNLSLPSAALLLANSAMRILFTSFGDEAVSLNSLAARLRRSPWHISHVLSQQTRHSFVEHVDVLRILKAVELLAAPEFNISEIANAVGFRSASLLDRHFDKHVHMAPSLVRRALAAAWRD
jgi:AraC-like DNA-binding protein